MSPYPTLDPDSIARWLVREIHTYSPRMTAPRVADRIGVQIQHVVAARAPRTAMRTFRQTDRELGEWPPRGLFNWERRDSRPRYHHKERYQ